MKKSKLFIGCKSLHRTSCEKGFSLIEIMVGLSVLALLSSGIMQMSTTMSQSYRSFASKVDKTELIQQMRALINDPQDCDASFYGATFRGNNISDENIINAVDLWSTDQDGVPLRRRFSADPAHGLNLFGRIKIKEMTFFSPDYTAGVDFPAGDYVFKFNFLVVMEITGREVIYEFSDIKLRFETDSAGLSEVQECEREFINSGYNDKLEPINFRLTSPGLTDAACEEINLSDHCGDQDGCTVRARMVDKRPGEQDRIITKAGVIYMEQADFTQNNNTGWTSGFTETTDGDNRQWFTGPGTNRRAMFSPNDWVTMYNYKHSSCPDSGGSHGPAFSNPYRFNFRVNPAIMADVTIYD